MESALADFTLERKVYHLLCMWRLREYVCDLIGTPRKQEATKRRELAELIAKQQLQLPSTQPERKRAYDQLRYDEKKKMPKLISEIADLAALNAARLQQQRANETAPADDPPLLDDNALDDLPENNPNIGALDADAHATPVVGSAELGLLQTPDSLAGVLGPSVPSENMHPLVGVHFERKKQPGYGPGFDHGMVIRVRGDRCDVAWTEGGDDAGETTMSRQKIEEAVASSTSSTRVSVLYEEEGEEEGKMPQYTDTFVSVSSLSTVPASPGTGAYPSGRTSSPHAHATTLQPVPPGKQPAMVGRVALATCALLSAICGSGTLRVQVVVCDRDPCGTRTAEARRACDEWAKNPDARVYGGKHLDGNPRA